MRVKEDIIKEFIGSNSLGSRLWGVERQGALLNPKLQLEVLLDIREILIELDKKINK